MSSDLNRNRTSISGSHDNAVHNMNFMRVNMNRYKTKIDADPYLTLKSHNTIYQDDKSFDCDNLFSLSWQRQVTGTFANVRHPTGHVETNNYFRGKRLDLK